MIDNLHFALQGGWKVLYVGLLMGAGLPLVFALGVRSLAWGNAGSLEGAGMADSRPHPAGRLAAILCFVVVVAAVAIGITIIVAAGQGKEVSFSHVYPTLVPKS